MTSLQEFVELIVGLWEESTTIYGDRMEIFNISITQLVD